MTEFTLHTPETAPDDSKPLLAGSLKGFGMIPNLHAVLAESPEALNAYKTLTQLVVSSSLSTEERHVAWLVINVENDCRYCVPAHTFLAKKDGVREDVIAAVREDREIPDARLEALRKFAKALTVKRGHVDDAEVDAFVAAGYTKRNVFDLLLVLSHKVLSNYTNHVAHTPVDPVFAQFEWAPVAYAAE